MQGTYRFLFKNQSSPDRDFGICECVGYTLYIVYNIHVC